MKLSILTNMVTPYRLPFFREIANDHMVQSLRVLSCSEREVDRSWQVNETSDFTVKILPGFTLNLKLRNDGIRILHFRIGIIWELLRHRPDTLVIGDASWTSFLAALACKTYGIKYVVWNEITTTSQISQGLVARLRRWMYCGADRLIASCDLAKNFLLKNGVPVEKIDIVLNAVDNDYFLKQRQIWEPKRDILRKELGVEKGVFCFIFVGKLISRKRVIETVELLAKAAKEQPIHLLVVGTGPQEEAMRTEARRHEFKAITFCGYAQSERLSQLYVASDALILLSKDEPWGMVINEALLFDKGFIATKSTAAALELACEINHVCSDIQEININEFLKLSEESNKKRNTSKKYATPHHMSKEFLISIKR